MAKKKAKGKAKSKQRIQSSKFVWSAGDIVITKPPQEPKDD